MVLRFKLKNASRFSWEGLKGWAYNTKEDFSRMSVAFIEVTGRHGKIKNTASDRGYIIIEGSGKFIIDDEEVYVEKFDVIIIPKNTPYDYKGNMKLFLVDSPAFDADNDVKME